jgi:hypothetical protein
MQSDTPQGDPRLQRIDPEPIVATGFADPCIVYLETTLPGEIPLLVACWARSSREVHEPGKPVRLELEDVRVFNCSRHSKRGHKGLWITTTRSANSLVLKHGTADRTPDCSYFSTFQSATPHVFQWAIRYLDQETDLSLIRDFNSTLSPNSLRTPVTKRVFEMAKLDWPSIAEVIATAEKVKRRRPVATRHTLVNLLSSVFKKKPQPAHA